MKEWRNITHLWVSATNAEQSKQCQMALTTRRRRGQRPAPRTLKTKWDVTRKQALKTQRSTCHTLLQVLLSGVHKASTHAAKLCQDVSTFPPGVFALTALTEDWRRCHSAVVCRWRAIRCVVTHVIPAQAHPGGVLQCACVISYKHCSTSSVLIGVLF